MEIKEMKCFLTVCKYMNFTKAGQELLLSQQGISKCIKNLENDLGVSLFYRNNSKLTFTEYGFYLYSKLKIFYSEYNTLLNDIHSYITKSSKQLRIAIPYGLTWDLIGEKFHTFYEKNNDAEIEILQYNDYELENALDSNEADIGFCISPIYNNKLKTHRFLEKKTYYMISEKNLLSQHETISLEELKKETFIGFGKKTKGHEQLLNYCHKYSFEPNVIAVNDIHILYQLIRENQGIGFYVSNSKETNFPLTGIKIIPDKYINWTWKIIIATNKNHPLRSIEKALINVFDDWNMES